MSEAHVRALRQLPAEERIEVARHTDFHHTSASKLRVTVEGIKHRLDVDENLPRGAEGIGRILADDPSFLDANVRSNYSRAKLHTRQHLLPLDVAWVARVISPEDRIDGRRFATELIAWAKRFDEQLSHPVHVINGGKS